MTAVKTLGKFLAKYGPIHGPIDRWSPLDEDKTTPGFQNKKFGIEEIVSDFNNLSYEDRFVLFRQFRSGDERELLRAITNWPSFVDAEGLMNAVGQFKSNVYGKLFERKDKWEIRFEIEKGLFAIGDILEMAQATFVRAQEPVETFAQLREKVFGEMVGLYRCTGSDFPGCSSTGGNMYWDTDDDFSHYADPEKRDIYFDDKDSNPLDPYETVDIGTRWRGFSPGESVSAKNLCDVERDKSGRYKITVKIHLKPAEDLKDERMMAKLQEPQYLEWNARLIRHFYETHREAGAANIDLDIQFVLDPKEAHHIVKVSGNNFYRSHSMQWRSNILYYSETGVMLHEIMHLLGLPDYYHETGVDSKARDRTLKPGFVLIDPENIMNGPPPEPIIRATQMTNIIYSAWRRHVVDNDDKQEIPPANKPSALEIAKDKARNAYRRRDFKELEEAVQSILEHNPDSSPGLAYSFICHFEKNGIEGARPLLDNVSGLGFPYNEIIIDYLCGRGETALAEEIFLKSIEDKGDQYHEHRMILRSFAYAAFRARNFPKAKEYFERCIKVDQIRNEDVPIFYSDYIETLEELHEYEKIAEFYRSRIAKDPYNIHPRKKLIGVYIKARDYQNAAKELALAIQMEEDVRENHRLEGEGIEWVRTLWQTEEERKSLLENLKTNLKSIGNPDSNLAAAYTIAINLVGAEPIVTLNP